MKTTFWLTVVPAGLLAMAVAAPAQSVFVYGAVNYSSTAAPAYQVGGCGTAVQPAPATCAQPVTYVAPAVTYRSPTVIYVGAGSGYPRPNYYSGWGYGPGCSTYYAPNVIYFGGVQSWAHGYAFRHYR